MDAPLSSLHSHWLAATAEQREQGALWYPRAREACRELATLASVTPRRMAAVVAVLSPRLSWRHNLMAARTLVMGEGLLPGLGRNVAKARAILAGGHIPSLVRGVKVRAFYQALAGDDSACVADSWMVRAAGLDEGSQRDVKRCAALLVTGAQAVGVPVVTYQATVWVVVRGSAD